MKRKQEQRQEQKQDHGRMPGIVTVAKSACEYLGIDYAIVFKPCRKAAGSSIEAIALLMEHMHPAMDTGTHRKWSDDEYEFILHNLRNNKNNVEVNKILRQVWSIMASQQIRELLRTMYKTAAAHTSSHDDKGGETNDSELQNGWFTIIHATRLGGSNTSRFSDYVLGVCIDEDELTASSWVPIGKVKARPPQALAAQLDALLTDAVMERFGPTVSIKPSIMVEVRHRGFRENGRTKAGKVLVDPEITKLRSRSPTPDT
jgi:hypothetical protein